jgi:hypothetical protein
MARVSDGRIGVSVNVDAIEALDKVKEVLRTKMGISASYTQAIQFVATHYVTTMIETDNVATRNNVQD